MGEAARDVEDDGASRSERLDCYLVSLRIQPGQEEGISQTFSPSARKPTPKPRKSLAAVASQIRVCAKEEARASLENIGLLPSATRP